MVKGIREREREREWEKKLDKRDRYAVFLAPKQQQQKKKKEKKKEMRGDKKITYVFFSDYPPSEEVGGGTPLYHQKLLKWLSFLFPTFFFFAGSVFSRSTRKNRVQLTSASDNLNE